MLAFNQYSGSRTFEISMLSGESGKVVQQRITAQSAIDVERKKSEIVQRGHTVFQSREIQGTPCN